MNREKEQAFLDLKKHAIETAERGRESAKQNHSPYWNSPDVTQAIGAAHRNLDRHVALSHGIQVLECLLEDVEKLKPTITTERIKVGIKMAIQLRVQEDERLKQDVEAGFSLDSENLEQVSSRDKRVLRARGSALAKIAKNGLRQQRKIIRGRDTAGFSIARYQEGEANFISSFMKKFALTDRPYRQLSEKKREEIKTNAMHID